MVQTLTPSQTNCLHCGTVLRERSVTGFCCSGCLAAHELIKNFELDRFYDLVPSKEYAAPLSESPRLDYSLFDTEDFQKGFTGKSGEESREVHFFLGDMSCYACVWVCEQVTRKIDPKSQLSINMTTGEASLILSREAKPLSEFVRTYETLGYSVTPNRSTRKISRSELNRIGVAFFCLMNVMMLAFPEYLDITSLTPLFKNVFRGVSSMLAGIAVFYSGWPFLKNAVMTLRNREIHLDFPIGLALIVGYTYSFVGMIRGGEHVYFDSMTAVVTLLLSGRFIQTRALEKLMREQASFLESSSHFVRKQTSEGHSMVPLTQLQKGETIHVLPGEVIPLRCLLLSEHADVSYGLLKGESLPQTLSKGDEVLAGAVNGTRAIELESLEPGRESFLLRLQSASRRLYQEKGRFLGLSERFARFFVVLVLSAAFGIGLYFLPTNPEEAFRRFAAVLLVACPCIFGFGAPLVIAKAFGLGLKKGVIFRSQLSLENLGRSRRYFFDKTGTLTKDEARIATFEWKDEHLSKVKLDRVRVLSLLVDLPRLSRHHVAEALAQWAIDQGFLSSEGRFSEVVEHFGQGLSFRWEDFDVRLGRKMFCEASSGGGVGTYLTIDGFEVLRVELDESLRGEAKACLKSLKDRGAEIYILSGDQQERLDRYQKEFELPPSHLLGNLSPHEKLAFLKREDLNVMVGNGINDTLASSGAAIGVALASASDAMKEASDIVFRKDGLSPLTSAVALSEEARHVMTRCFALALAFNAIAMSLALSGIVTPVMAAVLMPTSSLTVFLSSQSFRMKRIP